NVRSQTAPSGGRRFWVKCRSGLAFVSEGNESEGFRPALSTWRVTAGGDGAFHVAERHLGVASLWANWRAEYRVTAISETGPRGGLPAPSGAAIRTAHGRTMSVCFIVPGKWLAGRPPSQLESPVSHDLVRRQHVSMDHFDVFFDGNDPKMKIALAYIYVPRR